MKKIETGASGEDFAVSFLKKNGYAIIERNVRTRHGEIDIVARQGGVVCFVEVRTRRSAGFDEALASVDSRKQRRLSRLAVAYLKERRLLDRRSRFDVVAVKSDDGICEATLIKDAFALSDAYRC